ncbi:MAG TPA: hypothetical protein VKA55_04110 [Gammaproteobacteria bacterium]|nr:hypothetical protein [Gammaproteobacteria bacterium]
MQDFSIIEWNALVNRARATLTAQRACGREAGDATACPSCGLAESPAQCRRRFRDTERELADLARSVPGRQNLQLRRTVDGLELAYRGIREKGLAHG